MFAAKFMCTPVYLSFLDNTDLVCAQRALGSSGLQLQDLTAPLKNLVSSGKMAHIQDQGYCFSAAERFDETTVREHGALLTKLVAQLERHLSHV